MTNRDDAPFQLAEQDLGRLIDLVKDFPPGNKTSGVYRILDPDGWVEMVQPLMSSWLQDQANLRHLEGKVHRSFSHEGLELKVLCYCLFELTSFPTTKISNDLRVVFEQRPESRGNQAVVVIAIDDLSQENGCWTILKAGRSLCFDVNVPLMLPASKGKGRGIIFHLAV